MAVLESSFDGIFLTDQRATPLWCNRSYEVISGLQARDVLGIPMEQLVKQGVISKSATIMALDQGHAVTIEQTFTTGKRALVTSTPIYDETDKICMVVTNVRDVSELFALQETLTPSGVSARCYEREIELIREQILHTLKWWPRTPPP